MSPSNSSRDRDRLLQLISAKCNGILNDEAQAELEQHLAASAEARDLYAQRMLLESALEWEFGGKKSCDSVLNSLTEDKAAEPAGSGGRRRQDRAFYYLAATACLLIGGFGGALLAWKVNNVSFVASLDESGEAEGNTIGWLKAVAPASDWSVGRSNESNPSRLVIGDAVWVDRGTVELKFTNNIVARLEAPAVLKVLTPKRIQLLHGRITADVPENAVGFIVETTTAEVIDLGTSFTVDADAQRTDVIVLQGLVDLKPSGLRDEISGHTQRVQRLRQGEAARVKNDGTLSRIVNVRRTDLALMQNADSTNQPLLIESVTDNIHRKDVFSFYEIVAGGMGEDKCAYVDRPHEWNGGTPSGMPHYLVGGDYVKTFNNDKITKGLRVEVTLNHPAVLYVLFDQRAAQPEWLTRSFEDTGDVIGVDETDFDVWKGKTFGEFRIETGPGQSIDRTYSIWRRVVPNAGVVSLGANGLPAHSQNKPLDLNAELCMYGIVAVPLAED